jgi:hypothetical protein
MIEKKAPSEGQNSEQTRGESTSDDAACSPSSLIVDGCPMVEGSAKAMSDEISRLGIMRRKHCSCHACGKQVRAADGYPIIKEKYRYSIQCDSCDEIVYGHSVDSVCKQWVALYPENV